MLGRETWFSCYSLPTLSSRESFHKSFMLAAKGAQHDVSMNIL